MVDNIDKIKELLKFESEDDFYHLQIIKRKKEHPELGSNSAIIKTYYIRSLEYLDFKYPEIKSLCEFHNARACINLNRRSFEKIAFHTLRKIIEQIMNKDYKSVRKAYESVCGTFSNEPNKKWIIDIDDKDFEETFDQMKIWKLNEFIDCLQPVGHKQLIKIPTKNGFHLISPPFDLQEFSKQYTFDVHRDNPTLIFVP